MSIEPQRRDEEQPARFTQVEPMRRGASRSKRRDWGIALLVEAGALLSSSLDLRSTMSHVAQLTIPALADLCVIDLCDAGGSIGQLAAAASADPALARELEGLRSGFPLDLEGKHPAAEVIRSGRAMLLPDMNGDLLRSFAQSAEHGRFMVSNRYRSAVVAPLTARGRTLGALSALRLDGSEPYDEQDLELVRELGRRAALAMDNAQLYSKAQEMERRLEAVLENLAEAITVVDDTGSTVFANQAALDLLRVESLDEMLRASPGELMSRFIVLDEAGRELQLDAMPARRLFRGEPAPPLLVRNIVRATGEERWLMVRASPILDPDTGRIAFAANVLENVTKVKQLQLAEAFMAQASRVLASSMDYEMTLKRVARLAASQLADWCAVDVLGERGELERVAIHHNDPEKLALAELLHHGGRSTLDANGAVQEVIRTGRSRIFNDIEDSALASHARDEKHLGLLREIEVRDAIIVPLAAPARTLGAITLVSSRKGRRLTEADLDVAIRLGRRSGTAVESARLYTERTRIARVLQHALLPDALPDMPGFELAASYRAAGELNEVGGDFYDVFPCVGGRWMLVIGDVCGKGAEAASVTALARHTLRAVAMLDARPTQMLRLLHRALREHGHDGQMCTVCLVLVGAHSVSVELRIALAGHPRPLIAGAGDQVVPVGEPGTVLGVVDPIEVNEVAVDLRPQDTLLLFTDGVSEAGGDRSLSLSALKRLVAQNAGMALEDMLNRIEAAAVESAGGEPRDDIALLALRLARPGLG